MPIGTPENDPAQDSSEPDSDLSGLRRRSFFTLASGAVAAGTGVAIATPAAAASVGASPGTASTAPAAVPDTAPGVVPASATAPPPAQHPAGEPDFGPNVYIFDSSTATDTIQSTVDAVYAQQAGAEFGTGRYALLFKGGLYDVDVNVGYYTQ
ncbi:MAG: hypothetical protein QOF98_569, partial [Streptomyces sp.]|nr:hypothetical protein [Streptomyces sp.]